MIYELATIEELQAVYDLVQHTIKTVYPKYYPAEVVVFFWELHCKEAIKRDIENGYVSVLKIDGNIIGTGCFADNHITRVYVLSEPQKMGYGTFIIKHERYSVESGVILACEVMEKELHKASTDICYDGRRFIQKMNSENGEVSEQTTFTYHQNGKLLWADYSGGDILRGSLIGTVSINGELDFVYHHMNQDMQVKTGKSHSVPIVLEDGRIELSEKWEWTSGDYSEGESLLVEV